MTLAAIAISMIISACGGEQGETGSSPVAGFFPERVDAIDLVRNSSIDTYVGDSLYEYINGGAELYHLYGFELVSTASYSRVSSEIILDIYQFENAVGCFGLYSMLRPDEPTGVQFGVEGFSSTTSTDFVKGRYLIRLTTFEASAASTENMSALAAALDQALPGADELPQKFALFPTADRIPYSDKIHAEAFLGHQFLTDVYTRDYRFNDQVVTMLLTEDANGEKLAAWRQIDGVSESGSEPFAPGEAVLLQDDYYGDILAGRVGDYFIGIVNYQPDQQQILADWMSSLLR
jgi:hypothetical protein